MTEFCLRGSSLPAQPQLALVFKKREMASEALSWTGAGWLAGSGKVGLCRGARLLPQGAGTRQTTSTSILSSLVREDPHPHPRWAASSWGWGILCLNITFYMPSIYSLFCKWQHHHFSLAEYNCPTFSPCGPGRLISLASLQGWTQGLSQWEPPSYLSGYRIASALCTWAKSGHRSET